jgi:hypothetical protein
VSAHDLTELSATTVELVARRVSRQHRRIGSLMLIFAAVGGVLALLALVGQAGIPAVIAVGLIFVGGSLYIHAQRQGLSQAADRIAETAANRLDLDWTYHRSTIQAHDRKGPHPTFVLDAVPRRAEVDAGLPAARVHRT